MASSRNFWLGSSNWVSKKLTLGSYFPAYYHDEWDSFRKDVNTALLRLEGLRHHHRQGAVPVGHSIGFPDFSQVTSAQLPQDPTPLNEVLRQMLQMFDGMPFSAHPMNASVHVSSPNKASIIATLLANYTSQNQVDGEYSWNTAKAEMECVAMITALIDTWSSRETGGVFTFDTAGCFMYAVKYAMSQVLPSFSTTSSERRDTTRKYDMQSRGTLLCSQQGHYTKWIVADWLGLGIRHVVDIETDDVTNEMDMFDLEDKFRQFRAHGIPVIAVVCTMGTWSSLAMDNVELVSKLIDKYPNPEGYGRTVLYCDASIGWALLAFRKYNFNENPLEFSADVLHSVLVAREKIAGLKYADCVGIDFHRTGWTPNISSLFMVKDLEKFKMYMTRAVSMQRVPRTDYTPGLYTLEVSRSGAPALSAWATLRYLGLDGMQTLIGSALEISYHLRKIIAGERTMVCCNELDHGFVTMLRIYAEDVDAKKQYEEELWSSSKETKVKLEQSNDLQLDIAERMVWWLRTRSQFNGVHAPYISFAPAFQGTDYSDGQKDDGVMLHALRCNTMNVNMSLEDVRKIVECIKLARDWVVKKGYINARKAYLKPLYGDRDRQHKDGCLDRIHRAAFGSIADTPTRYKKRLGRRVAI